MSGRWTKIEMEPNTRSAKDGYIKLWENGVLKIDCQGETDGLPGTAHRGDRGYARNYTVSRATGATLPTSTSMYLRG